MSLVAAAFVLLGSFVSLLSGIGMLRFRTLTPDSTQPARPARLRSCLSRRCVARDRLAGRRVPRRGGGSLTLPVAALLFRRIATNRYRSVETIWRPTPARITTDSRSSGRTNPDNCLHCPDSGADCRSCRLCRSTAPTRCQAQLEAELRRRIDAGEFSDGRFPTDLELTEGYEVSRHTVRRSVISTRPGSSSANGAGARSSTAASSAPPAPGTAVPVDRVDRNRTDRRGGACGGHRLDCCGPAADRRGHRVVHPPGPTSRRRAARRRPGVAAAGRCRAAAGRLDPHGALRRDEPDRRPDRPPVGNGFPRLLPPADRALRPPVGGRYPGLERLIHNGTPVEWRTTRFAAMLSLRLGGRRAAGPSYALWPTDRPVGSRHDDPH